MRKMLLAVGVAIVALSMPAKEKTMVVATNPAITCHNCVNKIKSNLRFVKGVSKIDPSLKTKKVAITYDDKKGSESEIIKGFQKIGYSVTILNPDSISRK